MSPSPGVPPCPSWDVSALWHLLRGRLLAGSVQAPGPAGPTWAHTPGAHGRIPGRSWHVGMLPFCGALGLPGSLRPLVRCWQCVYLFAFKQASCEGTVYPHPVVPGLLLLPSVPSRGRQTRTVRAQVPPPAPMPLTCGLIWGSWAPRAGETAPLGTVPGWMPACPPPPPRRSSHLVLMLQGCARTRVAWA